MKKFVFSLSAIAFLFSGWMSQAQTVDEILKKYFETTGQDKMVKVKTMTTTGKMSQGSMDLPFLLYNSRPLNLRMELTFQGQKIIQVFDGTNGWMINPMTGSMAPQDMPPVMIKQMKEQADMDGMLYNYKEKGSTLEFAGKEEMEGTEVYKLKLTNKDGDITYFYIDTDSNILLKTTAKRSIQGNEIEGSTLYGNYQMVEGIAVPFSITSVASGQPGAEIILEKVEFNKEVPDSLFSKPAGN